MSLEEIHQGMELWKRRQVSLMPRHWGRPWLDVREADSEGAGDSSNEKEGDG